MKTVLLASLVASAVAFAPSNKQNVASSSSSSSSTLSATKADLEALAAKCNPIVKYFDPLNVGLADEATISWYRQAEIKHGRVAMAAFVGYVVQSNYHFPWKQTIAGDMFPSIDLTPEAQWDAIPYEAKIQIITLVAFLEFWDESGGAGVLPHYTRGRKPGEFPSLKKHFSIHPVLDLYDPFNFHGKLSDEKKEEKLVTEINNGRLAMLGIMGFVAANKIPGSVPVLDRLGAAPGYDGNPWIPFEAHFTMQ